jgi:hypothetical protein
VSGMDDPENFGNVGYFCSDGVCVVIYVGNYVGGVSDDLICF